MVSEEQKIQWNKLDGNKWKFGLKNCSVSGGAGAAASATEQGEECPGKVGECYRGEEIAAYGQEYYQIIVKENDNPVNGNCVYTYSTYIDSRDGKSFESQKSESLSLKDSFEKFRYQMNGCPSWIEELDTCPGQADTCYEIESAYYMKFGSKSPSPNGCLYSAVEVFNMNNEIVFDSCESEIVGGSPAIRDCSTNNIILLIDPNTIFSNQNIAQDKCTANECGQENQCRLITTPLCCNIDGINQCVAPDECTGENKDPVQEGHLRCANHDDKNWWRGFNNDYNITQIRGCYCARSTDGILQYVVADQYGCCNRDDSSMLCDDITSENSGSCPSNSHQNGLEQDCSGVS